MLGKTSRRSATLFISSLFAALAAACASSAGPRPASANPDPQDASQLGISVTSIKPSQLANRPYASVMQMLEGRVPGLRVLYRANGDYTLRIRSESSINGDGEPLIVLNGLPLDPPSVSMALRLINPQDVATIDVVRDAGAAYLYGARAENGAIIITTRH